jgi:hypothetical protein
MMYSSTYTGGVAHLVAQMRSAKFQNRISERISQKKILFFRILPVLRAAHLVAPIMVEGAGGLTKGPY